MLIMEYTRLLWLLPIIVSFTLYNLVTADLPIHGLLRDIKGNWNLFLTKKFDNVQSCGGTFPNKNKENLREEVKDYKLYLKNNYGGIKEELMITLSDSTISLSDLENFPENTSSHRNKWKLLGVYPYKEHRDDYNVQLKPIGYWTPVYDEGFEVKLKNKRFMAFLKYFPVTQDGCKVNNGDNLNKYGHTECYVTDSSRTQLGWYTEDGSENSNGIITGCFYGEKIAENDKVGEDLLENTTKDQNRIGNFSMILQPEKHDLTYPLKPSFVLVYDIADEYMKIQIKQLHLFNSPEYIEKHNSDTTSTWKAKMNYMNQVIFNETNESNKLRIPYFIQQYTYRKVEPTGLELTTSFIEQPELTKIRKSSQTYACPCKAEDKMINTIVEKTDEETLKVLSPLRSRRKFISFLSKSDMLRINENRLPKTFSWGDPFSSNRGKFPSENNQSNCGSCYILAAEYAFRRRLEIQVQRLLGKSLNLDEKLDLSSQFLLSCSMFNQGCDGGYPYLVGKDIREFGIPGISCMSYNGSDNECPLSSTITVPTSYGSFIENSSESLACLSNNRWYARDYGYIGGCYECNNCSGEENIMEEIYENGPIAAAFEVSKDFFSYSDGVYDNPESNHARLCDNPEKTKNLTGWEYTNHAVSIVGWGEENLNGKTIKYWIALNTWGNNWGNHGFFKIIRGKNLGGIESQATYIDPDFTRGMGKNLLQNIPHQKLYNKKFNAHQHTLE